MKPTMFAMSPMIIGILMAFAASGVRAQDGMHNDDPLLASVMIDQLEWRDTGSDPVILEGQAWVGRDLDKLWLDIDAEYVDGRVEELELQALYSRAITPFWDLQAGWRHDARPTPERDWLSLGLHGLAPGFLETEARMFLGESGHAAARLEAEYDALLTQRLILSPEIEMEFNARNDRSRGTGSGLSELSAGLRLRYEIRREFAPYIGIQWKNRYGNTAEFRRNRGQPVQQTHWVAGIRMWL